MVHLRRVYCQRPAVVGRGTLQTSGRSAPSYLGSCAHPQHWKNGAAARGPPCRENDNAYYVMVVRPDFQAELVDIPIKIPHHMELVRPPSRCVYKGR